MEESMILAFLLGVIGIISSIAGAGIMIIAYLMREPYDFPTALVGLIICGAGVALVGYVLDKKGEWY